MIILQVIHIHVNEYYRIRQTNSGFYLLNFEREMNQVFDAKE